MIPAITREPTVQALPAKGVHPRPISLLELALWFGVITSFGELVIVGAHRFLINPFLEVNPHEFWMMPLVNCIVFGSVGLLLLLFPVPGRRGRRWWVQCFGLSLLFCAAILFRFHPSVSYPAGFLLAAGLATQGAHRITRHAVGFDRLVRVSAVPLAAIVTLAGIAAGGWAVQRETTSARPSLPPRKGMPNVLLVVLDTVRAHNLSLYGYPRPTTPNLDRFATSGVWFQRAFATAPWTLPTHGSLFTGCFPHELFPDGATPLNGRTPLDPPRRTLAEELSSHGYRTGGFVANLVYGRREYGLGCGFHHYEDYRPTADTFLDAASLSRAVYRKHLDRSCGCQANIGRKSAADVNRAFLHWLDVQTEHPFFAFLNYFDAHDPYVPPAAFASLFDESRPYHPQVNPYRQYDPQAVSAMQTAYDRCLAYVDEQVGLLLEDLRTRGLLDNTLVVITSDHGEHFGEHGLMSHGNSLYRSVLEVPLIVSYPRHIPAGLRVREPVSLRDLPATIAELLSLGSELQFPGSSLAPLWNGLPRPRGGVVFSELLVGERMEWWPSNWPIYRGAMQSLIADGYHYIRNGDGREELYDFERDPQERSNLSATPEGSLAVQRLRRRLPSKTRPPASRVTANR